MQWQDLFRELRYAIRSLRRTPAATLAAIGSLGIGIGVVVSVLAIVDALFFRTIDVPHPESLVSLYQRGNEGRGALSSFSYPQYEHLRDHSRSFDGLAAYSRIPVNARLGDSTERLITELVTNNYFEMLRLRPVLGRTFLPQEGDVAILGYRFWRDRLGRDPGVVGRKLILNDRPFMIVGVLPESFQSVVLDWGKAPNLWVPISSHAAFRELPLTNYRSHWMLVAGRVKQGVRLPQVQAESEALSVAFYETHPTPTESRFRPVAFATQEARFWPGLRSSVVNYASLLVGVGALTFLMGCFNTANLLLSRAEKRRRELGIQIAIGAGRLRLARALLLETVLLAICGAASGILLARLTPLLFERFPSAFGVPLALDLSLNLRVLGFVVLAAAVATVLAGVSPLRLAHRLDVVSLIKAGAREEGRSLFRFADGLVVAQVAICLIALTGAGLFLRTIQHAQASDPMFRAGNALLTDVDLLSGGYDQRTGPIFLRELLGRVRQLPGVEAAAFVKTVPLGGFRGARDVRVEGRDANVQVNTVSSGYFGAAGIPIVQGRDLADGESASVVVNEQAARRFWPGQQAVGKKLDLPRQKLQFTVAGVVRDGRMRNFREQAVAPCVYVPLDADYQFMLTLYVRTTGSPAAAVSPVRGALRDLNRNLPFEATTLDKHLATALAKERLAAVVLTGLAMFTTVLAAIGLYGVISVTVSQRAREIGIRMALGSRRERVVAYVLKRYGYLLSAGVVIGLAASAGLARSVESLLYGVRPMDPFALGSACLLLAIVAAGAAAVPAMRAAFTDPMSVLRQD